MEKKQTRKKSQLKAPTKLFRDLLKRAAEPLSEEEAATPKRKKHGGYNAKRIRRHKAEDASD